MRLSPAHGYVGMYVVSKAYRGLGIGKQVWSAAIEHLGDRNKGLSAVAQLFTLYRDKAGFGQVADWTVNLYKLDNMALIFQCKRHHQARYHFRQRPRQRQGKHQSQRQQLTGGNGKRKSMMNHHSLYECYKNISNCHTQFDCSNCFVEQYDNQCNFFCLANEYINRERKYLRQINSKRSNELSDDEDESYGFSKLFFNDEEAGGGGGNNTNATSNTNSDVSDLDEEAIDLETRLSMDHDEDVENRTPIAVRNGEDKENVRRTVANTLGCCIKLRHYCNSYHCNNGKLRTIIVSPENEALIDDVLDYDRKMHSYDRSRIVRCTLGEQNCISRVALLGQTVVGYGCVKPNLQNMWMISPLYADNEYVARLLLLDLVTDHIFVSQFNATGHETMANIVLKTPSNNQKASRLLEELGFVKQEYTLRRCYTKEVFQVPTQSIYALHTSVYCTE